MKKPFQIWQLLEDDEDYLKEPTRIEKVVNLSGTKFVFGETLVFNGKICFPALISDKLIVTLWLFVDS